ncbi:MAG: multicopper oxidase family protein [Deltaproteobacteria bacterium]|nr:multicopper oxidase family protein [Deltaproteobacteria bacterium]
MGSFHVRPASLTRSSICVFLASASLACGPAAMPPVEEPVLALPPLMWGGVAAEDLDPDPDVVEVSLRAEERALDLGGGKVLPMFTYNGLFPGPRIEAKVGDEVVVHFFNDLDTPQTIHWHGLRISDQMDGSPRIQDPVEPGGSFEYRFVVPDAGTYWYHPHVRSNVGVERGLQGALVVHDPADPHFDLERVLVLDDLLLGMDGNPPPFLATPMEQRHGRQGNVMLTNGQLGGTVTAEAEVGQVERWRLVNSANARTMVLTVAGASFWVVGTDGGRLPEPYRTSRLTLTTGQRYDLQVHYETPGRVTLVNRMTNHDMQGNHVMVVEESFSVSVLDTRRAPTEIVWAPMADFPERAIDRWEEMIFDLVQGDDGLEWRINGRTNPMRPIYTFEEGDTVSLRLRNESDHEHPFHLHGQFFEIAGTANPGLKDTVLVTAWSDVLITAYLDNPGRWMAHCHNLEHAELGMMAEILINPAP